MDLSYVKVKIKQLTPQIKIDQEYWRPLEDKQEVQDIIQVKPRQQKNLKISTTSNGQSS